MTSTTYPPDVISIMKEFKESMPYRGTLEERQQKFGLLLKRLAQVYAVRLDDVIFRTDEEKDSGSSFATQIDGAWMICLRGRLSIITALHEFGHCLLGSKQSKAKEWSYGLFREIFPVLATNLEYNPNTVMYTKRRIDAGGI